MIRLRQSGVDEIIIKRVQDWYDPGPGCFFSGISGTASFSPTSLFAAGEQGVYFDPNNTVTLFEDTAGTIPTALERPVGLMLDLSGRGNHATSSSTKRPTLTRRVNQFVNSEILATQSVTTRATTQTLRFEGTGSITLSGTATGAYTAGTYNVTTTAGTLTATVAGTVTRADLREANIGVGLPAYQRVGDTAINAADYDTTEFPAWLRCSGGQSMVTPSINFTGTDKMTVWAGMRKFSDAVGYTIFCELGVRSISGSFGLGPALAPGTSTYNFVAQGTTIASYIASSFAAPQTNILSMAADISGSGIANELFPRVNGLVPTLAVDGTSNNVGTGNFSNYPLYLFARNQSSLYFNGLAGPIIVRGAQSSAAEISNAENWINAQQKVY